jgi:hypothetical protein
MYSCIGIFICPVFVYWYDSCMGVEEQTRVCMRILVCVFALCLYIGITAVWGWRNRHVQLFMHMCFQSTYKHVCASVLHAQVYLYMHTCTKDRIPEPTNVCILLFLHRLRHSWGKTCKICPYRVSLKLCQRLLKAPGRAHRADSLGIGIKDGTLCF